MLPTCTVHSNMLDDMDLTINMLTDNMEMILTSSAPAPDHSLSSSTQGSTPRVSWSLELVTIIAMPPTTTHHPENFLSKRPSTNSLIHFYKRCVLVQSSTVRYNTVQYREYTLSWEPSVQRIIRSKGQNIIEIHSRLGHLKNISHPSLFPEEGPSC